MPVITELKGVVGFVWQTSSMLGGGVPSITASLSLVYLAKTTAMPAIVHVLYSHRPQGKAT